MAAYSLLSYITIHASAQYHPARFGGRTANQLVASAEEAIGDGRLRPGDRLPPVRALAAELGASPATVAAAYRELGRRGLARGEGRRGTRVLPRPAIAIGEGAYLEPPAGARDLATGLPAPELLPGVGPVLASVAQGPAMPVRSPNMDDVELVERATQGFADDGIAVSGVAVVGGALDGVERIAAARLRPGDAVAVEDPGFPPLFDLLAALGLERRPVALDDRGLVPEALDRALAGGAGAVVLTPRAQNPTGAGLDPGRAAALRSVLDAHPAALVIEDDHAGAVAGAPALSACDPSRERWAVVRSVSKSLGPDLRLAVVGGDELTLGRIRGRQLLATGWVSQILQRAVARMWAEPRVERLIRRAAGAYAKRREALIAALDAHGIAAHGASGLNVWVPVRDELATTRALLEAGWAVSPGERYRVESGPAIRITIVSLDPSEAAELAGEIASSQLPGRSVRAY